MPLDPELLKQLVESFSAELDEHLQVITTGLLALEKNTLDEAEHNKMIEMIFRSAHNIKGTSRSLGMNEVSEIAHRIESIFSMIQKRNLEIKSDTIDLCLEAVDRLRDAFTCFVEEKPLSFDLVKLLEKLETGKSGKKEALHPKSKAKKNNTHDSIHVPIHKIEKVSSLLEEIQVNRIAITDHYDELSKLVLQTQLFSHLWKKILLSIKSNLGNEISENLQQLYNTTNDSFLEINKTTQSMHKNMRANINDLSLLSHSLQEEVGMLRMVPIGNLLCTFPRYVRDLSQELNKKIELVIKGEEVKVDKMILEGLKDPMIHLLRNAIDHGIEGASVRKKEKKPEEGRITIEIKEEEGHIIISIMDDGAGIDIKKLSHIAENKKILTKSDLENMHESEKLDLIFRPGFSTKEIITDVSGRGIGLDVVKSNIEDLKGEVSLTTLSGKGTTFTLSVPLSIATERGLLVKCGGIHFVIPSVSVEHVLMIESQQIIHVQGGQTILLEKISIPLRSLADILQLENKGSFSEERLSIVVVKKGRQAIALVVDEIIGEREIVIKPLREPFPKIPCVAGGTLLESNQVIIVFEPGDLIKMALQLNTQMTFEHSLSKKIEKPHILVVDDSITTRTLEKNVLESRNYQVTVAVNGKEAWDMLQKQKFSLLITDIMMPMMDGFALTEHVKRNENLRDLPVIIVTSLGSDAEKKRGIDAGADAYIVKSEFESGALLDIVSQLL